MGIFGLPLRKSTDTEPKAGTILKEGKQIMIFSPALALLYIRLHMIHCVSVFSGAVNDENKADAEGASFTFFSLHFYTALVFTCGHGKKKGGQIRQGQVEQVC